MMSCSEIDEYGFRRRDRATLERSMAGYIGVLARRQKRWDNYITSDPELKTMTRTLKRFIRKGVPLQYRKLVWMSVSGCSAAMKAEPHLYADLLRLHHDIEIVEAIKIDLPRTFPDNILFPIVQNQLFNVLIAFSNYDRSIGYCQGLNYIAGLLLLVTKDEEVTFWLLKHLLKEVTPNYHIRTMSGLIVDVGVFVELVRVHVPEVYSHVRSIGLSWTVLLTKWFICIFSEVLPTETVFRIWDCIFSEGHKVRENYRMGCIDLLGNALSLIPCRSFSGWHLRWSQCSGKRSSPPRICSSCRMFLNRLLRVTW